MFDVNISFSEIEISSIEKEDVKYIHQWCNKQKVFLADDGKVLEFNEFYQRFLEYYFSECEIFLKIITNSELIGIFRGRIEFKKPSIVWISCFTLKNNYLKTDKGEEILNKILLYFSSNFGICKFLSGVPSDDKDVLKLLKNSGFEADRVSDGFFIENGKKSNAIILKKESLYEA